MKRYNINGFVVRNNNMDNGYCLCVVVVVFDVH